MSEVRAPKNSVVSTFKLYLFPSLVTILAMMIWRDVNELRSDVKQLLAESNSNKAKVEILEKQVAQLNQAVFKMPRTASNTPPDDNQPVTDNNNTYAILNNKEEYYIENEKYLPYKTN